MTQILRSCCQCEKTQTEVLHMVALRNGATLCGECIDTVYKFAQETHPDVAPALPSEARTPADIVAFLDQYIVGQHDAKQTMAIAVHNHYKRLHAGERFDVEIDKSNVLLLGPTGTGKTLLAQTIARFLNVPFAVADATSLTQAGYVGDDVETILQRLIQSAGGDVARAQRGIVFIDEVHKLAAAKSGPSITRDVSGEGVQQALLKIIEGARVSVPESGNRKQPNAPVQYIDTKEILFICAGAFVGLLDKLNKPAEAKNAIGFVAQADVPEEKSREVTPEMLADYGMIREFIGRLPIIQTLDALDVDALERILTEPKNAVVRQMAALLQMDGATLHFEEGAIRAVAAEAHKLKTGARGARSILEKLLKQAQFVAPSQPNLVVTVKADLTVGMEQAEMKMAA